MADEWKITEAVPQLVVASEKAFEAADFYENLFGAQKTRYNEFPMQSHTSDRYFRVACVELTIGSSPFVVRDFDSINSRVVRDVNPRVSTCLRLQCLNLDLSMAKAVSMGCTVLKEILEDPIRPGVMIGIIRDPFGHVWELSNSSYGASEDGFMNTECMNVLLQDWSKSERDEHQGLFETYTFTPIVGSCQTKKNAVDVFDICRRRGPLYDPIMFDCKYMAVSNLLRQELNHKGTLVGLADPSTSFKDRERCIESGADFVVEKPLNLKSSPTFCSRL